MELFIKENSRISNPLNRGKHESRDLALIANESRQPMDYYRPHQIDRFHRPSKCWRSLVDWRLADSRLVLVWSIVRLGVDSIRELDVNRKWDLLHSPSECKLFVRSALISEHHRSKTGKSARSEEKICEEKKREKRKKNSYKVISKLIGESLHADTTNKHDAHPHAHPFPRFNSNCCTWVV